MITEGALWTSAARPKFERLDFHSQEKSVDIWTHFNGSIDHLQIRPKWVQSFSNYWV